MKIQNCWVEDFLDWSGAQLHNDLTTAPDYDDNDDDFAWSRTKVSGSQKS